MDVQTIVNLAGAVALATIGWLARELWGAVKALQNDLHNLEVEIPKSYVTKDDFQTTMKHIEDMFQRIYDKLDNKADKRGP
jgi:hypothetical protein